MRRPRDFDAELKALTDRARQLKEQKLRQLGELVIACKSNKKTEPCPILRAIEKEDRP